MLSKALKFDVVIAEALRKLSPFYWFSTLVEKRRKEKDFTIKSFVQLHQQLSSFQNCVKFTKSITGKATFSS